MTALTIFLALVLRPFRPSNGRSSRVWISSTSLALGCFNGGSHRGVYCFATPLDFIGLGCITFDGKAFLIEGLFEFGLGVNATWCAVFMANAMSNLHAACDVISDDAGGLTTGFIVDIGGLATHLTGQW